MVESKKKDDDEEDIYLNFKEEKEIDPENISKTKSPNEKAGASNEKNFEDDVTGG